MTRAISPLALALAALLWPVSVFVSWMAATGMGFGMHWRDYAPTAQLFLLAPFIVLLLAGAIWIWKRRLLEPAAVILIAPIYQALHVGAFLLFDPG